MALAATYRFGASAAFKMSSAPTPGVSARFGAGDAVLSDAERARVAANIHLDQEERLALYARYGVYDHGSFQQVIREQQSEVRAYVNDTIVKGNEAIQALDELLEAEASGLEFEESAL